MLCVKNVEGTSKNLLRVPIAALGDALEYKADTVSPGRKAKSRSANMITD